MCAPLPSSLLRAYHRGNESAARSLYAQCAPGLIKYAQSILRDGALAEDVVQSVFCKVLVLPAREIRRVKCVRSWLVRLVRNEAISMRRSGARRSNRELAREAPAPSCDPSLSAESVARELRMAVERLKEPHREVIILKCAVGMTFDQIALALDLNRSTAASRYREAIVQLRNAMGVDLPAPMPRKVTSHA